MREIGSIRSDGSTMKDGQCDQHSCHRRHIMNPSESNTTPRKSSSRSNDVPSHWQLYLLDPNKANYDETQDPTWLAKGADRMVELFARLYVNEERLVKTGYRMDRPVKYKDPVGLRNCAKTMEEDYQEAEELMNCMAAMFDRMAKRLRIFGKGVRSIGGEVPCADE